MSEEKIVKTTMAFDCGGRCPLRVHVKDGVIVRIEGDEIPEPDQLRPCLRCRAVRQLVYHPERLLYPQKRVGEKGEGKFERISWDEALDTIAGRLKSVKETHGNSSIMLVPSGGYIGALHGGGMSMARLLSMFGGYRTIYGNVSSEGAVWASLTQYGSVMVGNSREDLMNSKLIVMWGWDPARMISGTNTMYHVIRAKENGAKVICVDPRYHDSAAVLADQWIPIRPGTDAAMMAAMAQVMIENNLHDLIFLDKYTIGFDKYEDYVMGREDGQVKTPDWAEGITGVPAETIERLAWEYAGTKPAALMDCQGPARSAMGEQFNRSAATLCAMTGNVGRPGGSASGGLMGIPVGHMFRGSGLPPVKNPAEEGGPSVRGSLDLNDRLVKRVHTNKLFDAIHKGKAGGYPYDVKMAWFTGNNYLNQLGNTNKSALALKQLEFMVVAELFLTPTARYADIVLPVTSAAERSDLTRPWPSGPYFTHMNKAIEPRGECKSDFQIACLLAERLGIEEYSQFTEDQWLKLMVEHNPETGPIIPDYEKFKEEGIHRVKLDKPIVAFSDQIEDIENNPFPTPSGRIEIYSQRAADIDDPMSPAIPKYLSTWEDQFDPLAEKYPLQLLTPHPRNRVHSELQKVEWLRETEPHVVWINPVDAEARGLQAGDDVLVYNDRGTLGIKAFVTNRIIPGVAAIFEGAYYAPDEKGVCRGGCVNVLTKDAYSRGGASCLNTALVEVSKE